MNDMANCQDCIHYKVCYVVDQMTDLQEYKTAKDLKDDCEACILTADVVPKSEYDNLKSQFDALDHECDRLEMAESNRHDAIEQAKTEVAREIFAEIELKLSENDSFEITSDGKGLDYFDAKLAEEIAELKKKYQEGEPND